MLVWQASDSLLRCFLRLVLRFDRIGKDSTDGFDLLFGLGAHPFPIA